MSTRVLCTSVAPVLDSEVMGRPPQQDTAASRNSLMLILTGQAALVGWHSSLQQGCFRLEGEVSVGLNEDATPQTRPG